MKDAARLLCGWFWSIGDISYVGLYQIFIERCTQWPEERYPITTTIQLTTIHRECAVSLVEKQEISIVRLDKYYPVLIAFAKLPTVIISFFFVLIYLFSPFHTSFSLMLLRIVLALMCIFRRHEDVLDEKHVISQPVFILIGTIKPLLLSPNKWVNKMRRLFCFNTLTVDKCRI